MSVTLAVTANLNPIATKLYTFAIGLKATGDGSAGVVVYNAAIPITLQGNDIVTLKQIQATQDDASTLGFYFRIYNSEWSSLSCEGRDLDNFSTFISLIESGGWTTDGSVWILGNDNHNIIGNKDLLLGNPKAPSPRIHCIFSTNTNAKLYQAALIGTIYRPS